MMYAVLVTLMIKLVYYRPKLLLLYNSLHSQNHSYCIVIKTTLWKVLQVGLPRDACALRDMLAIAR